MSLTAQTEGTVYLVGAGPGAPDLITVAGREVLRLADCVVYDRLVDERLLEETPTTATHVYVGKQTGSGRHRADQDAINQLLIEHARRGECVVRLKGGDPLLFARGAEETTALWKAGIPYQIIPGVTAALAAAAMAEVPLTHYLHSSAVAMVTGQESSAKKERLDWQKLANFPGTLVLYMALSHLADIARQLIAGGKDEQTPLLLIEWAGTNRQRVANQLLGETAQNGPPPMHSPVLVILGEVCALRGQPAWFEQRPLFGQRILIPRPSHQARTTVQRLESLGAQTVCQPVFEIQPPEDFAELDAKISRLREFAWVVFSSRNGVESFLERLLALGHDARVLGTTRLAAIGPGTAQALQSFHLRADLVPDEYRAEGLVAALAGQVRGQRVLLVRANRGREILSEGLLQCGAAVESVVAYCQIDVTEPQASVRDALRAGQLDWVLFSSGNMARGFFAWLDDELANRVRQRLKIATISPLTSQVVRDAGFEVAAEAAQYTLDGVIDAVIDARAD